MLTHMFKILVLGGLIGCIANPEALAQYRGYGGSRGGGSDDRSREEMRKRYAEMRSRYSNASEDERQEMRKRFEEMRSRGSYGGSRSRGDDKDRGDDRSRSGDSSRSRSGRGSSTPAPYEPASQTPITVDLPGNYAGGDSDGDGQITLFEWRQWKPQAIGQFLAMDANHDGFLTAREAIIAENFPNETPPAASTTSYAATYAAPTPPSGPGGRDAEGNPSGGNTAEKPSAAEARYVFQALDKDRDGSISAGEWGGSKTVREGFDKAGITLKVPANRDSFLTQYPAYRIVPKLRLPSD